MNLNNIDEVILNSPFYRQFSSIFNLTELLKYIIAIYLLFKFLNISRSFFDNLKQLLSEI